MTGFGLEQVESSVGLIDVSLHVVRHIRKEYEGKWLCLIMPLDVDIGSAYHHTNSLVLYFSRDGIDYEVFVSKL